MVEWHTYTEDQRRELAQALESLMANDLLTEEELPAARRLLHQFKKPGRSGEKWHQVYASKGRAEFPQEGRESKYEEGAEEILQRLEEALWRSKEK